MTKRSSVLLSLALTGTLAAASASAQTFWVPSPDTNGIGRPEIFLEVTPGAARKIEVAFVDTGDSAAGLNGSRVTVDNDEKPNAFNVTRYIGGTGMLRLVNDPGPDVVSGTLFLANGSNDVAWPLPILTQNNWFQGDEVAYLQNLARNAKGRSNIEIMNFGSQTAVCDIQLRRPKGGAYGNPKTVTLVPLSHEVVKDPFQGIVNVGAGLRADVHCNQPFYAYGTFVGETALQFRMLYPLSVPPVAVTESLEVNRPGIFFAPKAGNSELDLPLPLVPDRAYRRVTIDFDVNIKEFTPIFTGLVGMVHAGGPRFNKTLYFGTFIRGNRARTLVDLGSPVVEPALRIGTGWKQNALHHVTIVYDTETATTRMRVTRNNNVLMDVTGGAYNLDLADRGQPVRVVFGLRGVADNAYYPPLGWKFSNLKIRIDR